MKRVGLFGGSFDPIHLGHLNMAISLMEMCALDLVYFSLTGLSPFKADAPPRASFDHRKEMVRLAISSIPAFQLLDWESDVSAPSYTIDTVRKLAAPSIEMHLLIGEDHLSELHTWKEAEALFQMAPPLVAARNSSNVPMQGPFQRIQTPHFDISSTEIRSRLSKKLYCGHLLPQPVLDYITHHRLY